MPDDGSWKLTLSCTKHEGELIATADVVEGLPVLLVREPDPANPDRWVIEAYLDAEPDAATRRILVGLVPSAAGREPAVEYVPAADWVTVSQAGLDPIHAGRFFVHTATNADRMPDDVVAFRIEAGRAFGTGQHETTTGCLLMLDRLKRQGAHFSTIADIGTGTGLLAFAANRLWPVVRIIASDIDPVSIEVAAENAAINNVPLGTRPGAVELVVAAGMTHRRLRSGAPYDLIIANILAGPLIDLAPVLSKALAPGGVLILAGLLDKQADDVAAAYRRQGLRLDDRIERHEWPTLKMVKRRRIRKR